MVICLNSRPLIPHPPAHLHIATYPVSCEAAHCYLNPGRPLSIQFCGASLDPGSKYAYNISTLSVRIDVKIRHFFADFFTLLRV
jgi:hypothetical protein